jgi:hypothetical protein
VLRILGEGVAGNAFRVVMTAVAQGSCRPLQQFVGR